MLTPGGVVCLLLSGAGVHLGACEARPVAAAAPSEQAEAADSGAPEPDKADVVKPESVQQPVKAAEKETPAPVQAPVVTKPVPGQTVVVRPPVKDEHLIRPAQVRKPGDVAASDVNFIAKVKDEALKAKVIDIFRKDPEGAKAAFSVWAGQNKLEGFELVSATYSGEVIFRLGAGASDAVRKTVAARSARDFAADWGQHPGVVYCDPDYTASPKGR